MVQQNGLAILFSIPLYVRRVAAYCKVQYDISRRFFLCGARRLRFSGSLRISRFSKTKKSISISK